MAKIDEYVTILVIYVDRRDDPTEVLTQQYKTVPFQGGEKEKDAAVARVNTYRVSFKTKPSKILWHG